LFNVLSDPQIITALQGIRPFLGSTGRSVSEMIEALGELIASESNQKAARAFAVLLGKEDEISTQKDDLTSFAAAIPYLALIVLPLIATQAATQIWQESYEKNPGPPDDGPKTGKVYPG
jgi:hypothetical protein